MPFVVCWIFLCIYFVVTQPLKYKILSGKFAIFAQNRTWVEKITKNREKSAESSELIFRFLRLHFGVEITILKL